MPWGAVAGAAISAYGNYAASEDSANASSDAAARSEFKPWGVTTAFGQSNFAVDPVTGQQTASVTTDPRIAAIRDQQLATAGASATEGGRLAAMSPDAIAQERMSRYLGYMQPRRQQQTGNLVASQIGGGTMGIQDSMGGNPLFRAQAQGFADSDALQYNNFLTQGQDLVDRVLGRTSSQVAASGATQGLADGALEMGAQLGGRSASAGATAGAFGQQAAAWRGQQGNAWMQPAANGVTSWWNNRQPSYVDGNTAGAYDANAWSF